MTLLERAGLGARNSAAGTAPNAPARFPCFDGLRAIAALTVIGVHTSFVSGLTPKHPGTFGRYTSRLEIGVEVFFVISGFLLYRPFVAARFADKPGPNIWSFWLRRLRRIIPAYWVAFLVVTYVMKVDTTPHTWDAPLVYLGFAQIYFPHYIIGGIDQAWSLCTEMTFYLFLPLYAAALARRHRPPRAQLRVELIGLVGLVAASFAWRIPVLVYSHSSYAHVMPNWLPGYLDQFALGMFLAVGSSWLVATGGRPAWLDHRAFPWACWTVSAVAMWAVSNIGLPITPLTASPLGPSLARQSLYGLFAIGLVAPAVFGPQDRSLIRALLRWRPLAFVGLVSYGVYLWHESWIYEFLRWFHVRLFEMSFAGLTAFAAALALATASASYFLVERPFQRMGRHRRAGVARRHRPDPSPDALAGARP